MPPGALKEKLLAISCRCVLKDFLLLFLLIFFNGAKDFAVQGLPTEGRRRLYQTSASPIPHPDEVTLKKSETNNVLRDKFLLYNVQNWPTNSATPQKPFQETGVKKSSTAGRPVERQQKLHLFLDSTESILNSKTRPNAEKMKTSTEGSFLVPGVFHDEDQLSLGEEKMLSKMGKIPAHKDEEEVFQRMQTPIIPLDNSDGVLAAGTAGVFKKETATLNAVSRSRSKGAGSGYSLESEAEVDRRGQTSRNPILPHTSSGNNSGDSLGSKRAFIFSDDTAKILQRKTLLYSEPFYRPTDGASDKNEHLDPRRLISILGDPSPDYKRSDIGDNQDGIIGGDHTMKVAAETWRDPYRKGRVRRARRRKAHFRHRQRQELLVSKKENWSQDEEGIEQTMDINGVERSPDEYSMLEHLIDDNSMSFGTKEEQLEKESTIKEVEELSTQSSRLYNDDHFMGLPDDLSTMEVSEGEMPSYDKLPGQDGGLNIRRNHISRKKKHKPHVQFNTISSQVGVDRVKTDNEVDPSTRLRLRKKKKRSLYHYLHRHHHWHSPYLHVRSHEFSPYHDYPNEQEPIEPIPRITRFMDFPRFPTPRRLPKFPMSLMSERFVPYPRLPKIAEYFPPLLETLEHYPEPPPIPVAFSQRERAGTRDDEPVDEWTPLPEPVPAPEPPPIPEPAPIPELAPIKEIPPIKEPQEKTPSNLDPKKTFDTGESNGGVKKSSSLK